MPLNEPVWVKIVSDASETILTHTGSLSGKENIYDALFKRMGVARCETLSELTELLKYFHTHGIISNDQISIMGPSGGDMAMLGDASPNIAISPPDGPIIDIWSFEIMPWVWKYFSNSVSSDNVSHLATPILLNKAS